MFDIVLGFINRKKSLNYKNKFKEIIKGFYNRQYIYCECCIRNNNKLSKMTLCVYNFSNTSKEDKQEANYYECLSCYSYIPLSNIKDDNYTFDNKELKEYIMENDSYCKIKCLLIFWKQPKNIIFNYLLLDEILNDLKDDNFHTLFQYDPSYLPV
jgi:hypothetical protein